MIAACIVVIELPLLDAKLFVPERLALPFLETIENLAILGRPNQYFARALDGLLASSHMPIRRSDLAREKIKMSVREPQAFIVQLAVLDDELVCQGFTAATKHFAARLRVGKHPLLASKEQFLLFFNAFALV